MVVTETEQAEITRAVDLYIEGMRNGDGAKLREAFHPQAWMFGSMAGARYDEPISELIALVDGHSVDVDGSYQTRLVSVDQVGDAAFAVLEEQGCWGTVSFTDFFTLAQIDGAWAIANKTFAHTGGEPPPM
ncbi:MAG: nuclear transport factor 2 family protein [Actinobacteria bacterium]|nr:nuclear transport factor 2 family protein [Actinomycetota bacterium]